MNMATNTSMKATLNGRFEAEGNLITRTQDPANFDMADGILRMIGPGEQFFEVAGTDNGIPSGAIGSNFQIGLLQIGTATQQSTVILQDGENNNSDEYDSEALYLQGFPSEVGLRLLNGSTLVLGGRNVYVANGNGGFFSARDLVAAGDIVAPFDGGFIALTPPPGGINNGDFNLVGDEDPSPAIAWIPRGPGNAMVRTKFGMIGNGVLEMTAGSPIEVSQYVSTLNEPFTINFESRALNATGTLTVLLDGVVLQTWDVAELAGDDLLSFSVLVDNQDFIGAIDIPLTFHWDADTGDQVWLDNISMTPVNSTTFLVTRGTYVSGGVEDLQFSDNQDLSVRRSTSDIQSRVFIEIKSTSLVANPATFDFTLEASVFARSNVVQSLDLFDYVADAWEEVDVRNASRFNDSTVVASPSGDLSRFVQPGTNCIEARLRFQSNVARQQFTANIDQANWTIE
jgi:hypothetical protein